MCQDWECVRRVEAFFATNPKLTERVRAFVTAASLAPVVALERICMPDEVDGSRGAFRASWQMCALEANSDSEAISASLTLHEAFETQRA